MSIQTEVRADSKSAESSKQTKNDSTKGIQNKNKKTTHVNSEQSTTLHESTYNVSTKKMLTTLKVIYQLPAFRSIQNA